MKELIYLDLGLFFLSLSMELFSLTCFQMPVLLTSSEMLIADKGMFMTFPLANGIFKFPAASISIGAPSTVF